MKKYISIFFVVLIALNISAQPNMQRDSSIAVSINGVTLKFPWAGGLNFTNWGLMDLDADGFKDIMIFDKSGGRIRTFLNDKITNQASFTHNPVYQDKFPFVNNWFATYDYNCDGLEDIFTYDVPGLGGGIRVYRNLGNLQFVQMKDYLLSDYGSAGINNIPNNGVGIPGLADVDHDGDMDVVVFDVMAYNLEYHQNQSKELYGNCDSLTFIMVDKCWGKFNEGFCQVQLDVCPYPKTLSPDSVTNTMHAGSGLMLFDADGDSLMDMLEGDLSCDSMFFLSNKGTIPGKAHMTSCTTLYPPSKPIAMSMFPTTYFKDVNNDGKRDLIAATNFQGSENLNNQWLYINGGADNSPNFNYVQNNFLQESMIDLGEGAYPTMFDFEGDGDLDLLVGNFGYYSPAGDTSAIAFFKNTGTNSVPTYSLVTRNFANLSSLHIPNLSPTTGDLDGDGDPDLLVGDNAGRFSYFTNTAGVGNPAVFSSTPSASYGLAGSFLFGMDVGNKAYPQIIDLDLDGKKDIVCGSQNGKICFYKNTGTTTIPTFSLITNSLGNINVTQVCSSIGQSVPFVFPYAGTYKMIVGSECGNLFLYDVPSPAGLPNSFTLISSSAYGIKDGEHLAPVLYDVDGDSHLDMVLGNYSGGLTFYRGLSGTYIGIEERSVNNDVYVFPVPATGPVNVKFNPANVSTKKIVLVDLSGRIVKEFSSRDTQTQLNVSEFANGIYFLSIRIYSAGGTLQSNFTQKIIISHE